MSWKSISVPALATHIPDTPPETKKKTKAKENIKGISIVKKLLTSVTLQCISFVAAGTEIITVSVVKSILVVCASPTIYIWCPHTQKPKKAMVYIEYIKLPLAEIRLRRVYEIMVLTKPNTGNMMI